MNLKIKCLRIIIRTDWYYIRRITKLKTLYISCLKRFALFNTKDCVVGQTLWDSEGMAYLDWINRVQPMLLRRIEWYEVKYNQKHK